jgi:hypothetical protein
VMFNRWVGVVAVLLVARIVAAIGLGVYFNRNALGHQQPKVFGGSEDEVGSSVNSTASTSATSVTKSVVGSTYSSLHGSPTFTVARREEEPQTTFTGVPSSIMAEDSDDDDGTEDEAEPKRPRVAVPSMALRRPISLTFQQATSIPNSRVAFLYQFNNSGPEL